MGGNNSKVSKSSVNNSVTKNIGKSATNPEIALSTAPQLPLETQTRFDGARGPFSFKTGNIGEDVLEYILQDGFLLQSPEGLLTSGFIKANDYNVNTPGFPKRYKFEGFFHSLPTKESVPALMARTGCLHDELSAPKPLKSFVRSVIRKNKNMFDEIINIFQPNTTLRHLFEEGKMLSDLAIQITYGDAAGPPYKGYRIDNVNSILHLALSIAGGNRILHIGYADPNIHKSQYTVCQESGDAYLSSAWVFRHAVQFPEQNWEERVIAIQCRTLYTPEENTAIMKELEEGKYLADTNDIASAIADILERYDLLIPTLDEVQEVENELA